MDRMRNLKAVEEWNVAFPVGTPVTVTKDRGEKVETKTRSEAWLLGSGHPVVMVEGIAGGYSLERITPNPAPAPATRKEPPYPFCSHAEKCIAAGRCENTVHGERWSCAD